MWKGNLVSIHITSTVSEAMQLVDEIRAIAGKGLEGDRYLAKDDPPTSKPDPGCQVTLIEIEAIEALKQEKNIVLKPGDARRNLVTRGVPLNHLVDKEFQVGEVRLRGVRLCEPCKHLAALTYPEVLPGLVHRGGLRAEILTSGLIRAGDVIQEPQGQ